MKTGYFLMATGIILFIISNIHMFRVFSNITPILKMNFSEGHKDFYIYKRGRYSIWKEYRFLTVSPLEKYKPIIINMTTGENIHLQKNIFGMRVKSFGKGKTAAYNFFAEEGQYRISLSEIDGIDKRADFMDSAFQERISKFGLQISKQLDVAGLIFAVCGITAGVLLFVFGNLFNLGIF